MPVARSAARGRPKRGVVVVSDQALIAEAVAAALSSHGLTARRGAWPAERSSGRSDGPPAPAVPAAEVGVALIESPRSDQVAAIATLVAGGGPTRWIVLTSAPPGPVWGAALEAGAALVLPRSSSLEEMAAAVLAVAAGRAVDPIDEVAMRRAWADARQERDELAAQLDLLTPREREVLEQLHRGRPVPEIAAARGVTVATVRHQVRSVLRKLGVTSQLAATARYARLLELVEQLPAARATRGPRAATIRPGARGRPRRAGRRPPAWPGSP